MHMHACAPGGEVVDECVPEDGPLQDGRVGLRARAHVDELADLLVATPEGEHPDVPVDMR